MSKSARNRSTMPGFTSTSNHLLLPLLFLAFSVYAESITSASTESSTVNSVVSTQTLTIRPEASVLQREMLPSMTPDTESPDAATTVFSDGFEGAFPGPWTTFDNNGTANGEVYWDDTSFRSAAGSWSASASDGGADGVPGTMNYPHNMEAWLFTGPFDLSGGSGGEFSFSYWLDTEPTYDFLFYGISTNGTNFSGYSLSGNSGGWKTRSIDLTNVPTLGDVSGNSSVYIAFVFQSDGSTSAKGAYVDEVKITSTTASLPDITISPLMLEFTGSATTASAEPEQSDTESPDATSGGRDLRIHMRKGIIDPAQEMINNPASQVQKTQFETGHTLMQFDRLPTASERASLEANGVRLLQYIPNNAYWVSVRMPISRARTESIAGKILWEWTPDPHYKLSESITDEVFPHHAVNLDGSVDVQVLLFEDVKKDIAIDAFQSVYGVEVVKWLGPHHVILRMPIDSVWETAALDQVHWVEPREPPNITNNATAANRINVHAVRFTPYSLTGDAVLVGVWDGGSVYPHSDFGTRLTIRDGADESSHATHVAGTIGGSGAGNLAARGMAPRVDLDSYDWDDNLTEMRASGADISNHSYGTVSGWRWNSDTSMWEDGDSSWFGAYTSFSAAWDDIVYDTNQVIFKSAGNDRNDGPDCPAGPRCDGNYDSIPHKGIAKNIMTICATTDSDGMSTFSSWGPANDGRVKPDLCANGVGLLSTYPDNAYNSISGTSMSSPSAAGAAAMLFQHFKRQTGGEPKPALLKALMIHGATDLGRPGPDYSYGWGLINAQKSAMLISNNSYFEGSVETGTQKFKVTVPAGAKDLKATLVWTDPEGSPGSAFALVNDLDLRLVSPTGTIMRPWKLVKSSPGKNAVRGNNTVDNVEQVLVSSPAAGTWTVWVSGTTVPMGPQDYALVIENLGGAGQFTISNPGSSTLMITAIELASPAPWISWDPLAPFSIAPGASRVINVSIDFSKAPAGTSTRRLLVRSNVPGKSPYPGGIFIKVIKETLSCYTLTRTHTGTGLHPLASPTRSPGCPFGKYHAGELIDLTARPASGWTVSGWSGTNDNGSTALTNKVTMPAAARTVTARYKRLTPCVYTLMQPNGGEKWNRGGTYSVNWSRTGDDCATKAKLQLFKAGVLKLNISPFAGTTDMTFPWKIPSGIAPGNDYRVKVFDAAKSKYVDTSDKNFSIVKSAPKLDTPTDVDATDGLYEDRVEVTWTAVANATIYRIWRCDKTDPLDDCVAAGFKKGGTTFDDKGGDLDTIYHYAVQACATGYVCSDVSDSDEGHREMEYIVNLYYGVAFIDDINGNGSREIAGLTTTASGTPLVVIKDSKTKATIKTRTFLSNKYDPVAIDSNGKNITVLARNRTTVQYVAQARNASTGALLFSVIAVPYPSPNTLP